MIKKIQTKNTELRELLEKTSGIFLNDVLPALKEAPLPEGVQEECTEHYVSLDYLDEIRDMGRLHLGYPECKDGLFSFTPRQFENQSSIDIGLRSKLNASVEDIAIWTGSQNTALIAFYPPDGYIGWHNNANASGFNIIFTFSENGGGYFEWVNEEGELVRLEDEPGWQTKLGYFPAYKEEEDYTCYHCAHNSSSGWRMTVAFMFCGGEELWGSMAEEIENE